jgi:hypothetical protein
MTDTLRERIKEAARQLARESHCRYCDRFDDPRLKCQSDLEGAVDGIIELVTSQVLEQIRKDGETMNGIALFPHESKAELLLRIRDRILAQIEEK